MNKRKILSLAMALSIVAIMAVGATLAYFTDTDSKTNTFTVGNVNIHIDEWMGTDSDPDNWDEYVDQELFPIDHSKTTFNKLVETVNDGSEAAYIRTFVTCPKDMYDYLGLGFNKSSAVNTNGDGKNMYSLTNWSDVGTYTINGEETAVFLCEYEGVVAAGESVLSLTKVWLYDTVTNADIERFDLTEGAFNVEVVSQAIQAENLTYAEAMTELGAINQALMDDLFN